MKELFVVVSDGKQPYPFLPRHRSLCDRRDGRRNGQFFLAFMSRPRPLNNLSSAISFTDDNASLTPRTPHSRTARLEGGFAQLQDHHLSQSGQDLFITQQREPLLASAQTDHFDFVPLPSKPKPTPPREQHSRTTRALLVLGLAVAAVLLLLIIVSYNWPGPFYRYFGLEDYVSGIQQQAHPAHSSNSTAHTPHSTISYENYTSFPLTGVQYLLECQKQMPGYMSHGDYWDMPLHSSHPMDVEHVADPNHRICNKTLTYLLDGRVGLAADLALMAQAAAIAREVRRLEFCPSYTHEVSSEIEPSSSMIRIGTEGNGSITSRM